MWKNDFNLRVLTLQTRRWGAEDFAKPPTPRSKLDEAERQDRKIIEAKLHRFESLIAGIPPRTTVSPSAQARGERRRHD